MRALALAEEAISRGWEVSLAGFLEGPALQAARRVEHLRLVSPHLDTDLQAEVDSADLLHIDTYAPLPDCLVEPGHTLVSSMADAPHGVRSCDLLIDANPAAQRRVDEMAKESGALVLAGPRYFPLRDRIGRERAVWVGSKGHRPRVLIVMGGTDAAGLAYPAATALAQLDVDLTVVGTDELASKLTCKEDHVAKLNVVSFIEDLAGFACHQDVVVTAAGTTVWELAHAGVPMVLVVAANNQLDNFHSAVDLGAAVAGTFGTDDGDALRTVVADLLRSRERRVELSRSASAIIDADGTWRIVASWESLIHSSGSTNRPAGDHVSVRQAELSDSRDVLAWRNDPVTRRMSRGASEVSVTTHDAWFRKSISDPDQSLLVVESDGRAVGVVRFDRVHDRPEASTWEVSINLSPASRGKGLAAGGLSRGEQWLLERAPRAPLLVATVHVANTNSLSLFRRAGYLPYKRADALGFEQFSKFLVSDRLR